MSWSQLYNDVKQKFQNLFGGAEEAGLPVSKGQLEQLGDRPLASPYCDVHESDKHYLIIADVPGASRDNTLVAWDERGGLSLHVRSGSAQDCTTCTRDWYRRFDLPTDAQGASAVSRLKDGVLAIEVPKGEAALKTIPITAG